MRTRIVLSLLVVSAASAVSTATAAAANNLGNGGFERPIISGMVPEPKGTFLGTCVPLLSGPGHCWQVTSDMTALVHDDFMTGGVAWAPQAGHQLLWLAPSPVGANVGGSVKQEATVPRSTPLTLTLYYAADPSTPPGTPAELNVRLDYCNDLGTACTTPFNAFVGPASTGDPAAPGWLKLQVGASTNADQTLARVRIRSVLLSGGPQAAGLADTASLK